MYRISGAFSYRTRLGIRVPQSLSDCAYASTDYALQTLTGIQGVFLAVYFTAVSVVAGAIYAEVPHEVRMLLLVTGGAVFSSNSSLLGAPVSLLLLGSRGLGWTTGKMVLLFSVLAGCYSIFAMFVVLRNSITLFDPARVGNVIFQDLAQAARSASIEGFAWGNRSFQVGYSNKQLNRSKPCAWSLTSASKNLTQETDRSRISWQPRCGPGESTLIFGAEFHLRAAGTGHSFGTNGGC